jgi:hypothetical protein
MRKSVGILMVALLAGACARAPGPRAETPARVKDSAPEKIAAHRGASGGLELERESERWGFEAARERRRLADQRNAAPPLAAPPATEPASGAVDLRATPR